MRHWAARAGLALAGIAMGLLLAEAALRVAGYARPPLLVPHVVRGFALRPNTSLLWTREGRARVMINSAGFRDVEHQRRKPAGVFRIAFLGDSFTEALQVPLDSTFWKRTERLLRRCAPGRARVEALSFGVSGYGTAQELITYETEVRAYAPDVVVVGVTIGNDLRDNSRVLTLRSDSADERRDQRDPRRRRPYFYFDGDSLRLDSTFRATAGARERLYRLETGLAIHSRLVQLAWATRQRLAAPKAVPIAGAETGLDVEVYREPTSPEWQDAWRITRTLIERLQRAVRRDGAELVVATLSQAIQVHPDSQVTNAFVQANRIDDIFYPDHRLRTLLAANGIPVATLAPALQRHARRTGDFLHGFANTQLGSGHWNAAGHRVAADALVPVLCGVIRSGGR